MEHRGESRAPVFALSSRVVGRDPIMTQLRALYRDSVAGTFKTLLLSGSAGMGKTALIEELRSEATQGGFYLVVEHAPETQAVPLHGLKHAVDTLLRSLEAAEDDPTSQRAAQSWRQHLQEALGSCLPAFLHAFPAATRLLGPATPLAPLPLGAHSDRLLAAVQRFFMAVANRRPLLLFFDDLHWADGGTLRVFTALVRGAPQVPLFLVGAYDDHPGEVQSALTRLQLLKPDLLCVALEPLRPMGVQLLLAQALHAQPEEVVDLTTVLAEQAGGMPLFLHCLLQTVWQHGMLQYAPQSQHWDLLGSVESMGATLSDVVNQWVDALSAETRQVLEAAACAGRSFEVDVVAEVLHLSVAPVRSALQEAEACGLLKAGQPDAPWRSFAHDCMREVLLDRLAPAAQQSLCHALGECLLLRHQRQPTSTSVFRALAPLLAAGVATPPLAPLCRLATTQARDALDYAAALRFLEHLAHCVRDDDRRSPEERAQATIDAAELRVHALGDASMQQLLNTTQPGPTTYGWWQLHVAWTWYCGDAFATVQSSRNALVTLHIPWHDGASPWHRWRNTQRLRRLQPHSLRALAKRPPVQDLRVQAAQRIIAVLLPAACAIPHWVAHLAVLAADLAQQHGADPNAWPAGVAAIMVSRCQAGEVAAARALRPVLVEAVQRAPDALSVPWVQRMVLDHLDSQNQSPEALARAYMALAQEAAGGGDLQTAAWASLGAAQQLALVSVPRALDYLLAAQTQFPPERMAGVANAWVALRDSLATLQRPNEALEPGADMEPTEAVPWLLALWMRGNAQQAWERGKRLLLTDGWRTLDGPRRELLLFVVGLSALQSADLGATPPPAALIRRILRHLGPSTPLGTLLQAERLARRGAMAAVAPLYAQACKTLTDARGGLGALAHECAARFYLRHGEAVRAVVHFHQAHGGYKQWGALARMAALEREFPDSLMQANFGKSDSSIHNASKLSHYTLDVTAIVNAISALSGEVVLDRLVQRVIQTVVENAGATRAIFVSCSGSALQVELDSAPHPAGIPYQLLWYVTRTRAPLLINSPAQDTDFKRDPYISERQPRCVLCAPVMHQGQTLALIYLENGLAAEAFSPDRVVLVQALATQAAISLDNARTYQSLEAQVALRTRELADAQATLMKTHQALRALDRAKSQFFANVSHEFRTPLTLILGPIEQALQNATLPEAMRQSLALCQRNGLRLLRLVDDMLALSRLESADLRLHLAPVSLGQALQDLVTQVQPWAAHKDIQITYTAGIAEDIVLMADATELERVVLNLLNNALKFTPNGGRITVRLDVDDYWVRVAVADTGIGVPLDALDKIFDRFYQVETEDNRQAGGTGIGLALCRKIVELHGGTIGASSQLHHGTTVMFTLPRVPVSADVAPQEAPASSNDWYESLRKRQEYRLSAFDMTGPAPNLPAPSSTPSAQDTALILLVDDKPEMLTYLASILQDRYQLCTAQDGLSGLHAARNMQPDLMITDVTMPNMSGYELLKTLRNDRELWHMPVVMLTANEGIEDKLQGLARGADAYLTKPFAAPELRAVVAGLLSKARAHQNAGRALRNTELQLLVAGISHEILNPLGFIRSALFLINEELHNPATDPEDAAAKLTRITEACEAGREGVERVRSAVGQLRQFNTNGTSSPLQDTTANRVVENVHRLTWHQIRFTSALDATRHILARSGEIEQVLINLLNNAHHATGAEGTVHVSTWDHHQGRVCLAVTDTGMGIPGDRLDAIFKPFVSSKVDGSGLGLYISRQIVREHGGDLRVSSTPGQGATFTIELPAVPDE